MNRLLTSVAIGLAGIQGITLAAESRPKLVVGIMVDQLRTDYLENLKDMFGPGGFRRLMDNGVYIKDLDYKVVDGDVSKATTVIQTGTYPRQNGITGTLVYNPSTKLFEPILTDDAYIGNFTEEKYSPAALRVATLTDGLSIDENRKSRIHSIAPDPVEAIVLAGHTGNSAFWINNETGRWSSTTYYHDTPSILPNKNYSTPIVSVIDTLKWTPLLKTAYPDVSTKDLNEGFRYAFSRSDRDVYSQYKKTPFVNRDVTDAATEYITNLNLGKNAEGTDVLNIGYTLAPYGQAGSETYRYPLEDAYLRLDKDLERLLSTLDKEVGKDNVVVYLVSTGYFEEPQPIHSLYRIPGGTFSVKRAMSLLNAFLSANNGNGAYIDHFYNGSVYLNKKLIEEKNLDPKKVAEEARDFLVKMSGVSDAFTVYDLMNPTMPHVEAYRHTIDPKNSGDIILEFNPGWKITDDTRFPSEDKEVKSTAYLFPAFIAGKGLSPKVIDHTVDAVDIAPTMAQILHIRAPNAAISKPLVIK